MLATAPQDLGAYYEAEIRPRLTVEAVYAGLRWSTNRGRYWRAACPLHGGDNPQAFSVDTQTLGWSCFTGSHKGSALDYLAGGESLRGRAYVEAVRKAAELAGVAMTDQVGRLPPGKPRRDVARVALRRAFDLAPPARPAPPPPEPTTTEPTDKRLEALQRAQAAYPDSPAAAYCASRGIPPELAARYGAGYVASWRGGGGGPRVVFPLEAINGHNVNVINLYGRALGAVGPDERHRYLSGPRGLFNASALVEFSEVFVTEATFDALALIAAGHPNAVALGGLNELTPAAFGHLRAVHLCLDGDAAGSKALHRLADAGRQMGLRVNCLPPSALAGHKDLSAAWQATGRLDLGNLPRSRALEEPPTAESGQLEEKRGATRPVEAQEPEDVTQGPPIPAVELQAAYRPYSAARPTWDALTVELAARLEASTPPAEPFQLGPGVRVAGPAGAWQAWRGDVASGPTGPRGRGALQADLRRLAELGLI